MALTAEALNAKIAAINATLDAGEAGVAEVQIGDTRIKYDRGAALRELHKWEAELARLEGRKPGIARIHFS